MFLGLQCYIAYYTYIQLAGKNQWQPKFCALKSKLFVQRQICSTFAESFKQSNEANCYDVD